MKVGWCCYVGKYKCLIRVLCLEEYKWWYDGSGLGGERLWGVSWVFEILFCWYSSGVGSSIRGDGIKIIIMFKIYWVFIFLGILFYKYL